MNQNSAWTPEEIQQAVELVRTMSAKDAAAIMSENTGRNISRSSLIGALYRNKRQDAYMNKQARGVIRELKPKTTTTKITKNKSVSVPKLKNPVYLGQGTCQWINPDNTRCALPTEGPWCETHRQVVFIQPKPKTAYKWTCQHQDHRGIKCGKGCKGLFCTDHMEAGVYDLFEGVKDAL
jgi:hypothetical protein